MEIYEEGGDPNAIGTMIKSLKKRGKIIQQRNVESIIIDSSNNYKSVVFNLVFLNTRFYMLADYTYKLDSTLWINNDKVYLIKGTTAGGDSVVTKTIYYYISSDNYKILEIKFEKNKPSEKITSNDPFESLELNSDTSKTKVKFILVTKKQNMHVKFYEYQGKMYPKFATIYMEVEHLKADRSFEYNYKYYWDLLTTNIIDYDVKKVEKQNYKRLLVIESKDIPTYDANFWKTHNYIVDDKEKIDFYNCIKERKARR